eukprot:1195050-Prorocentrum_minimum.AAC.2
MGLPALPTCRPHPEVDATGGLMLCWVDLMEGIDVKRRTYLLCQEVVHIRPVRRRRGRCYRGIDAMLG